MKTNDREYMEMAVQQAREQLRVFGLDEGGDRPNPKVGCVVVTVDGKVTAGYRGELQGRHNDHAEFIVLEGKLQNERVADSKMATNVTRLPTNKAGLITRRLWAQCRPDTSSPWQLMAQDFFRMLVTAFLPLL